ncbi:MAG: sulfite exporter TauE/SafE family protein [Planctomycetes bacterium]|nr:sulfite exporter TauE/SafE family protein [Planctomycetota bacterium]
MTSIGKGLLGTPALVLIGVDKFAAVGTVGVAGVFLMMSSTYKHYKNGNVDLKSALAFSLCGVPTSYYFACHKEDIDAICRLNYVIGIAAAFSVFALICRFYFSQNKIESHGLQNKPLLTAFLGLILGFFIGATSISGSLIVIAFILILQMPEKIAIGTTSFVAIFSLASASIAHIQKGNVDWELFSFFTPAVMIGAYFGAQLTQVVPKKTLQLMILLLLLMATIGLFLK